MVRLKCFCEACELPFWIEEVGLEEAGDVVCPYCGEFKDVLVEEGNENKEE